jgi:hypothetical protein
MTEKINIAEILKDCPPGMELNCLMYEDVYFDYVDEFNNIHCYIQQEFNKTSAIFNQDGTPNSDIKSKCVIYPKGKTTWEGFVPPCKFKDGDVLVHTQNGRFIMSIYKSNENEKLINTHVIFWDREEGLSVGMQICCYTDNVRFATKEEKAKLFDVIKDNGYKWNPETKTLEKLVKPKFKVSDKIKLKSGKIGYIIQVADSYYEIKCENDICSWNWPIENQDDWELVPNKFDTTTLIPFESKVLVRDYDHQCWKVSFFGYFDKFMGKFDTVRGVYIQCIPYEGNEHLLGKTDDCDNFFKNW